MYILKREGVRLLPCDTPPFIWFSVVSVLFHGHSSDSHACKAWHRIRRYIIWMQLEYSREATNKQNHLEIQFVVRHNHISNTQVLRTLHFI